MSREENINVLKGKLLTHRQFTKNIAQKQKLYCQYDELSEDIFINQTIKCTLRLLLPKAGSFQIKNEVSQLICAFDGISDKKISADEVARLTLNRNEKRFEGIIRLCSIFLRSLKPGTAAGEHKVFSLMFDMNQLFEIWVASLLKPLAIKHGWFLKMQGPKRYMAYREDIDQQVFQMKPDISLIDATGNAVLIVDAKWKLLSPDEAKLGVSQADMYQLQAYGNRYSSPYLCLIYPRQAGCTGEYNLSMAGEVRRRVSINSVEISLVPSRQLTSSLEQFVGRS